MRVLGSSASNTLAIHDAVSGADVEVYYRTPSTAEHVGYHSGLIKREGKKIKNNSFETRVKYGLKILTGVREGDFGDEQGNPISSDPKSPHYREDWKKLLEEYAPDIVSALALVVFEGTYASLNVESGDEGEDGEEAGETAPLPKSSDAS